MLASPPTTCTQANNTLEAVAAAWSFIAQGCEVRTDGVVVLPKVSLIPLGWVLCCGDALQSAGETREEPHEKF